MTTEIQEQIFQHKGRSFVSKLYKTANGFSVVVMLNGSQVSPSYSVDFVTHADYFMQHKEKLTEHLFALAQSDVEQELYFHSS
jgi:hypothetical protein